MVAASLPTTAPCLCFDCPVHIYIYTHISPPWRMGLEAAVVGPGVDHEAEHRRILGGRCIAEAHIHGHRVQGRRSHDMPAHVAMWRNGASCEKTKSKSEVGPSKMVDMWPKYEEKMKKATLLQMSL